jgi:propionyl-CoA carboxylase beta chain
VSVEQSGQDNLRKLESMKDEAFLGGGKKRIDAQHSKGKLTCLMMIHLRSSTC